MYLLKNEQKIFLDIYGCIRRSEYYDYSLDQMLAVKKKDEKL